ncbi:MAG: hypothetical protein ACOYKA_03270 [Legionellaceae bacterium]
MTDAKERVKAWLMELALLVEVGEDPSERCYAYFSQEPALGMMLVDILASLEDKNTDEERTFYSACIFSLDVCVSQLQSAFENGNKGSGKTLTQLMTHLAVALSTSGHDLTFWLPILNAFYEVHVDLTSELKQAYLALVHEDETTLPEDDIAHLNSIRDLIHELSDLSVFDIAENFFAQSYAMPADFFIDLMMDLFSMEEGQDIGLLALLHPRADVRDVVVDTLDELLPRVVLSSSSLSRLQVIKNWYPDDLKGALNRWLKEQRKKGVVFQQDNPARMIRIQATEVDGGGAQGLFIHIKRGREHRLCGLLFKVGLGIKDAWLTAPMGSAEVARYYDDVFQETVMLREVDMAYLMTMTQHFLATTLQQGAMPDLHLLEIQEELGVHFVPEPLDVSFIMEQLAVEIIPFTGDVVEASLKRTRSWPKNKRFTESWYVENAQIDKIVNRCCSFVDGVKVCRFDEAMADVFEHEMETKRSHWAFHFLWIALWLKAKKRKNEKMWQDGFLIAHVIHEGRPLHEIPIMQAICRQSVINSIETMHERRTHLTQE